MKLSWKLYKSIAFPSSPPFWRACCKQCKWRSVPHNQLPEQQIQCPVCSKDEKLIPSGEYCYSIKKFNSGKIITNVCPFWELNNDQPAQENGYCKFLNKGDWECDHISLLWDQVKECGINTNDNYD